MIYQNLIVYKFQSLYHILEELSSNLNFTIIKIENEDVLNNQVKDLKNYIIITKSKNLNFDNVVYIDNLPLNIFKLIEKINVSLLKSQFSEQSQFKINDYIIDLNSREIISKNKKLKLTEKEIDTIIHLSKKKVPVSINDLQKNVWSYQSDIETHTVETHIYRLRKKISNTFDDNAFIISKKNPIVRDLFSKKYKPKVVKKKKGKGSFKRLKKI